MIGCDRLYVHIQRVQNSCTRGTLGLILTILACNRHGPGTQETERSNMSHIVDMINIEMFTIEINSTHVMIGLELVNLDHVSLE